MSNGKHQHAQVSQCQLQKLGRNSWTRQVKHCPLFLLLLLQDRNICFRECIWVSALPFFGLTVAMLKITVRWIRIAIIMKMIEIRSSKIVLLLKHRNRYSLLVWFFNVHLTNFFLGHLFSPIRNTSQLQNSPWMSLLSQCVREQQTWYVLGSSPLRGRLLWLLYLLAIGKEEVEGKFAVLSYTAESAQARKLCSYWAPENQVAVFGNVRHMDGFQR